MILHGDALEKLKELKDNSIDSVVTDPPYGLSKEPNIEEVLTKWLAGEPYDHGHGGFMGKKWDSFVPHPDIWKEVYRVLKPGGHALVFAGTRTQDLMTIALRLAGFEVRDVIEWLYFGGFPKGYNIGRKVEGYDGWNTALKPAHEPIIMVRKPLRVGNRKASVVANVEEHGTGGLNIDECRIGESGARSDGSNAGSDGFSKNKIYGKFKPMPKIDYGKGRYPANCITLDDDQFYLKYFNISPKELSKKASKKDRNSDWQGNEIGLEEREAGGLQGRADGSLGSVTYNRNIHPTVKPTDLMAWLVRLVTPPNGTVLDPFAGSGSTLVAAKREGFDYVGIEITDEYIPIIKARLGE